VQNTLTMDSTSKARLKNSFCTFVPQALGAAYVIGGIWTQTFGEVGEGISGRLVLADLVGFAFVMMWLVLRRREGFGWPAFAPFYVALLLAVALGGITSLNREQTEIELLILAFLGATCCAFVNVFRGPRGFETLCCLYAIALVCVSIFGLYDATAGANGMTRVMDRNPDAPQVAIGGFRNSGQAGAYALVVLSVLTPLRFSSLYRTLSKRQHWLITCAIVLGSIFLLFTAKFAAWIGWGVGFLFCLIEVGRTKVWKALILAAALVMLLAAARDIAPLINPSWSDWVEFKVWKINGTGSTGRGFLETNYGRAMDAFVDRPFFGTGLGAFQGSYHQYEVHSTYIKMLAEGGMILSLTYLALMIKIIKDLFFMRRAGNPYQDFLTRARPFFFGCLVSWAYTYHLRKREFWIMVSIFWIARSLAYFRYEVPVPDNAAKNFTPVQGSYEPVYGAAFRSVSRGLGSDAGTGGREYV
jgi:hypothetical protein